jgi:hypothetical protein
MSELANTAMDKMGQILRTSKWLRSENKMTLQGEAHPDRGHFASSSLPFRRLEGILDWD